MACDEEVIATGGAKMDENARVMPADALAEDRGASQVEATEAGDQICSRESSSEAVVVDTAKAEPPVESTTCSVVSSGRTDGEKFTLAQLMAEDRDAGDRALSRESPPQTEIVDNTTAEPSGPISVILFGRTGSGKSTLAQMLIMGKLDPDSEDFVSSSGIRGETKELKDGEGRGWRVIDTPGFGEPKDPHSTISSEESERKIRKYIQMIEGSYTHFLYTVMRDRIDELDKKLWKFFVRLFGESIKKNFSVVISNASVDWVEQNREDLAASFKGCDSFLSAEFPTIMRDDAEWEMELEEIRTASLEQLENELAKFGRDAVECEIVGGFLKMTSRQIASSKASLKRMVMNVADRASSSFSVVVRSILQISGLMMEDGRVVLSPEIGLCVHPKGSCRGCHN